MKNYQNTQLQDFKPVFEKIPGLNAPAIDSKLLK